VRGHPLQTGCAARAGPAMKRQIPKNGVLKRVITASYGIILGRPRLDPIIKYGVPGIPGIPRIKKDFSPLISTAGNMIQGSRIFNPNSSSHSLYISYPQRYVKFQGLTPMSLKDRPVSPLQEMPHPHMPSIEIVRVSPIYPMHDL